MPESVTASDARLGAGALLFAIGIGLAELRMQGTWSRGVLLVVVAVPFVATLALIFARPATGGDPSPLTSLLCAVAFAFGVVSVYRLGTIAAPGRTFSHTGTLTWMALVVTAIGSLLGNLRHSAALLFLTIVAFSLTVLAGATWLFGLHGFTTLHYVALGLVAVFWLAASWTTSEWPRLGSVFYVAIGFLLFAITETQFGFGGLFELPILSFMHVNTAPWGWEAIILAGGFGLAAAALKRRDPGPGYIAGLVLVGWISMASSPGTKAPSLIGWPLLALLVGGVTIGIAVTSSKDNRFSLTRAPDLLAAGSLALAIAVLLTVGRFAAQWSVGVLLAISAAGLALTAAFALAQPREGNEPSGATSLLAVLTLGYAVLVLARIARLSVAVPFGHSGTLTWMLGGAAVVGAGLVVSRRSAGVGLATMVLAAVASLTGAQYLFDALNHPHSLAYVLIGVALLYLALGLFVGERWARLGTVSAAAAGAAVAGALLLLLYFQLVFVSAGAQKSPAIGVGWLIVALIAVLVMAGAAALRREAGPGYAAAIVAVLLLLLDARRTGGDEASLVLWPLVLLALGAVLAASAAVAGRSPERPADGAATSTT